MIRALTMTLLPEPVAPAMSRWGILARSTAWARPATSRPRAKVSFEPVLKSSDSRIPRSVTTLKSWLGISMPTALLPGIGASMRRVRAARAMARSSARASIRLSLTCGAGWTSYWVTTGPALRPTIWAWISKLASFLMMISSVRRWMTSSPPGAWTSTVSSRRATAGSVYSRRSRVGGESEASVTSSGSRTGRGRSSTAVAVAAEPAPELRAGANVADVGTAEGIGAGLSSPQMPVWPAMSPGPPVTRGPRARPPARMELPFPVAPLPRLPDPFVGPGSRRMLEAADALSHRPIAVIGRVSWLSRRLNAIRTPAIPRPTSRINAPTGVSHVDGPSARKVPTRPPPAPIGGAAGLRTDAAPGTPA